MTSEIRTNSLKSRAGLSTVTLTDSGPIFSGITTFLDNSIFNVGNINATGVVTATSFSGSGANLTGIAVGGASSITFNDDVGLFFGTGNSNGRDLQIIHEPSSFVTSFKLEGHDAQFSKLANNNKVARFSSTGRVYLYYDNSLRLETTSSGITLDGDISIADKIVHTGDTNTAIRFPAADTITAETGGSERLRITSTGKILVNTTTASSVGNSTYSMFEVSGNTSGATGPGHLSLKRGTASASLSDGDTLSRLIFSSLDGGDFAYIQASVDGSPSGSDFPASLRFHTCADGASSSTEKLRITSDGKVVINKNSGDFDGALHVKAISEDAITIEGNNAAINWRYTDGSAGYRGGIKWHSNGLVKFDAGVSGNSYYYDYFLNGSRRVRFTHDGDLLVGTTSNASGSNVGLKLNYHDTNPTFNCVINQGTGNHSFYHLFNTNASNNGYRFYVMANGGIANHSGNNSNLSDERMKKNITNMGSVYNSFKQFVFKDFNYITDEDSDIKKHGLIAQEVETIDSDLITEDFKIAPDSEGNDVYRKGLREEQFMMIGMKALQEAITKIEKLEEDNIALRARVTNLEGN